MYETEMKGVIKIPIKFKVLYYPFDKLIFEAPCPFSEVVWFLQKQYIISSIQYVCHFYESYKKCDMKTNLVYITS